MSEEHAKIYGTGTCLECSASFPKKATNQVICGMDCTMIRDKRVKKRWREKVKKNKEDAKRE